MTYLSTKKIELKDNSGKTPLYTAFGENIVTSKKDYISAQFHYNLSADEFNTVVTGSGSYVCSNSQLSLSTGTTAASSVKISSKDYIVYESGHEIYAMFTVEFSPYNVANSYQYIGCYDDYDGFYIGYNNTDFGIGWRKNQSDTFIKRSDFNINTLSDSTIFNLDPTKGNLFMITFGWLGVAPVVFWVHGGYTNGWIPFHAIDIVNASNGPTILNPILPITAQVYKSPSGNNVIMKSNCWAGGIYSNIDIKDQPDLRIFAQDGLKTLSANTVTNVLTLQNQTTYNTKPNKISAYITGFSYTTDNGGATNNKPVKISIYKNGIFAGTANYVSVDTDSIMKYDTAMTTYTSGKLIFSVGVTSNNGDFIVFPTPLKIYPGDKLTFTAWSSASNTVDIIPMWYEDF